MTQTNVGVAHIDRDELRARISDKYRDVALNPELGFHFHTGRPLTQMLGYDAALIDSLPSAPSIRSLAPAIRISSATCFPARRCSTLAVATGSIPLSLRRMSATAGGLSRST